MMNISRPIPESYWVKTGQFLAGEYPGSSNEEETIRRISAFLEAGFTDFIDLTQRGELTPYEVILRDLAYMFGVKATYTRMSIRNFSVPSNETMRSILSSIDESLSNGRQVYVHCWGGVGRTGTVVGCYLVRQGMTGEQALNQIAAWWLGVPKRLFYPYSPESLEQFQFIRNWREDPPPGSLRKPERGVE